ncbi:DUF1510 family protein [Kurthia massiliensis]|uniref:DUF1510 family protein n=1 Tax=Kurthia massiliensis TaxID=1033739 RepID=UPI00028916AA|nr:DUF1510 family protein [Kurthia massiliensis]
MEQPSQRKRRYTPKPEPDKSKSDKVLNILIGVVIVLILIVGYFVLTYEGTNSKQQEEAKTVQQKPKEPTAEEKAAAIRKADAKKDITERSTVTQSESTDPNVEMTIVDSAWKPTKTTQTENIGEGHVSAYDGTSVDWQEKVTTLAKVTNIPEEEMKIVRVKNGGTASRTIGIVTSADGTKKYRVTLQWIADKGWQAEQLEVLKSLDGTY